MKPVNVYRRRSLTLLMMVLFGAVTIVMIVGLVQSFFPRYSGLEDLKITSTGRMISIIFTLFMGAFTWVYVRSFIRRGKVPVIRIDDTSVHFDLRVGDGEVLYFRDIESFAPIEGNFETCVVTYRPGVPVDDPRYPASVEVPLGLTMTRSHVLAVLNERCKEAASQPVTAAEPSPKQVKAQAADNRPESNLPAPDRTVRIYWERWAPVVLEVGILFVVALLFWIKRDPLMSRDYLLFVRMSTWCTVIITILLIGAVFILGYVIVAVSRPKLVITPDAIHYRGVEVPLSHLESVNVESKRKRVAPTRYVTEHFIRFNYLPEYHDRAVIPGLDPDLLEMTPRRIASIINSRIKH